MAAFAGASLTGCGIAAPHTATTAMNVKMPVVFADPAAMESAPAQTVPATEAPTTVTAETTQTTAAAPAHASAETALTAPATTATTTAKAETTQTTTAKNPAKETTTETNASRDADFKWFTTGVYRVSTDGDDLDTYYVFCDQKNGRVDTVSGIGIAFTYTQNRSGVVFSMGEYADENVLKMEDASMNQFTGTMFGHTYTFTRVQDANPATFDAAAYENEKAQACEDGQNPVMNFIGDYSNGRAMMHVSAKGKNQAAVTVSWGSSAFQTTKWSMSGTVFQVGDTLVMDYNDCFCESFFYTEDGTLSKDVTEYTNGSGSITFEGSQAVWADFEQGAADGQVFSYILN